MVLKLFRILQLNNLITSSNMSVTNKTYSSLVKIILYLILYIHIVGCMWWKAVSYNSGIQFFRHEYGLQGTDYNFCLYATVDN